MMMSKFRFSLFRGLYAVAIAAPLLLAACSSNQGPTPMPTGYKYHNNTYKAPVGPEAEPRIVKPVTHALGQDVDVMDGGDMMTATGDDMVMAPSSSIGDFTAPDTVWNTAADDLISRIQKRFGQPNEPVFLKASGNAGFESALKQAMVRNNWKQTDVAGNGPFSVGYNIAATPADANGMSTVTVTLYVSAATQIFEESGVYSVSASPAAPVAITP